MCGRVPGRGRELVPAREYALFAQPGSRLGTRATGLNRALRIHLLLGASEVPIGGRQHSAKVTGRPTSNVWIESTELVTSGPGLQASEMARRGICGVARGAWREVLAQTMGHSASRGAYSRFEEQNAAGSASQARAPLRDRRDGSDLAVQARTLRPSRGAALRSIERSLRRFGSVGVTFDRNFPPRGGSPLAAQGTSGRVELHVGCNPGFHWGRACSLPPLGNRTGRAPRQGQRVGTSRGSRVQSCSRQARARRARGYGDETRRIPTSGPAPS
jgi:hypothetical protein